MAFDLPRTLGEWIKNAGDHNHSFYHAQNQYLYPSAFSKYNQKVISKYKFMETSKNRDSEDIKRKSSIHFLRRHQHGINR
jgi:hypothetical protein